MKFGKLLAKQRKSAKVTTGRLGRDARVDNTYIRRLEAGEQCHPGRDVVLRLAQGLLDNSADITLVHVDALLKAAGCGPLPRNRISIVELKR